jgi:hypothetical protein
VTLVTQKPQAAAPDQPTQAANECGMRRNPSAVPLLVATCMTAVGLGALVHSRASADEVHAAMPVGAAVVARTTVTVRSPETLTITAEDVRRGFVSVVEPVQIEVLSNTRHGLEIEIQAAEGLFTAVRVQGEGIDAILPGDGGSVAWRWNTRPTVAEPASMKLRFTLSLDATAPPGRHPWPLLVHGRALGQ